MLKVILITSIAAYIIVGYLTFKEYKTKFSTETKITPKKVGYIVLHSFLFVLIGFLITVLGYLILTM